MIPPYRVHAQIDAISTLFEESASMPLTSGRMWNVKILIGQPVNRGNPNKHRANKRNHHGEIILKNGKTGT
jgi:hypothetical protein